MSSLIKEIITLFIIIIFSNVIVELGEDEKIFMVKPFRFFGTALILSIIGGFIINRIHNSIKEKKDT